MYSCTALDRHLPRSRPRLTTSDQATVRKIPKSWMNVLKLAALWDFPSMREKALQYLKSSDCMVRLEISRRYDVEAWFLPAVRDLISRDKHLTAEEIKQLGLEFAVEVIAFREKARRGQSFPGVSTMPLR